MLSKLKCHKLLEESVSHHKLFSGTADVAVVMQDAHASETCDVHLKSNVLGHVNVDCGFLGWVSTNSLRSAEIVETFVSNFVNHFNYN